MVTCPSCSAANDPAARFCSSCGSALVRTCPSCGSLVPAQARFCPECGTSLDVASTPATVPVEERRVLSILFADLAGFTQRSDHADPEDVRGILVPFHAIAKEEIERFGGVLDKFIGDAALGVFGAPIAHEDDAERAVRAALAIRERVSLEGMPVRVAVNTGEALVTSGEGPQVGEHVAGDVVNTASRLQNLAPVGDVVVGETTARATRRVIDYEEMPPVTVKGKSEPLGLWLARSVRPTVPERDEDDPPPFVGRERERQGLRDLLERTIRDRTPHLVTVVGEPGLGKSRLLADLGEHVRAGSVDVAFHRGRCLPYGESITYAALVEIVRALADVAPDANRERAAEALDAYLPTLGTTADEGEWLSTRIHALVGPVAGSDQVVDRAESFAAWTRFLELSAQRTPVVMVVEDLHWAEPAMLEFLDHVVEQAGSEPLLVLCTARPELFTMNPSWGTGIARATTLTLSPLSDREMQELLGALLLRSVVPDDARGSLMRRAGGNPLYAREFVHMLEDRAPALDGEGGRDIHDD
ncbi:MAG TPA: AAA family ATPase, partial [Actinomycetota bacterium]